MALPAPLLDAVSEFEEAAKPHPEGDAAATARRVADARQRQAAIPELKEKADRLRTLLESLERDASAAGRGGANLDEIVGFLGEKEQEIHGILEAFRARAEHGKAFSDPSLRREERTLVHSAAQRFEDQVIEVLETLRDMRWRLMATRAEVEEPGDSPVCDNLQDFLQSLS